MRGGDRWQGRGGSHPTSDLLQSAEEGGDVAVLLGQGRLVGPDPLMEPRQQIHVVGNASTQLLRGVAVGVDETWGGYPGWELQLSCMQGLGLGLGLGVVEDRDRDGTVIE